MICAQRSDLLRSYLSLSGLWNEKLLPSSLRWKVSCSKVITVTNPFARALHQNLHWKLGWLTPSFGSTLAVLLEKYFFRNKTFLFFKIESRNFQYLFEKEFCKTSHNFNSFSLFRQFLILFFSIRCLIELKCKVSRNSFSGRLKISAFYFEEQKSCIPKKYMI